MMKIKWLIQFTPAVTPVSIHHTISFYTSGHVNSLQNYKFNQLGISTTLTHGNVQSYFDFLHSQTRTDGQWQQMCGYTSAL